MPKRSLLLLCLVLSLKYGAGQQPNAENSFTKNSFDSAVGLYNRFINKQSRLNSGKDYQGYPAKLQGHAYFLKDTLLKETVLYDDIVFNNVPIKYDIVKDEVLTTYSDGYLWMSLISEKLKSFTYSNHHFIRIEQDSAAGSYLSTGFYDELYTGKTAVLAKRIKFIDEKIEQNTIEQKIIEKNEYYTRKQGVYYTIKNYNGLMAVLKDHEKEVKQYLKTNNLRFHKNPENTILNAVMYYDALKK